MTPLLNYFKYDRIHKQRSSSIRLKATFSSSEKCTAANGTPFAQNEKLLVLKSCFYLITGWQKRHAVKSRVDRNVEPMVGHKQRDHEDLNNNKWFLVKKKLFMPIIQIRMFSDGATTTFM